MMIFDWSLCSPAVSEVVIVDSAAEQIALTAFRHKADAFHYELKNVRVSILRDLKIVRIDLYDPGRRKIIGMAIRVQKGNEVDEVFNVFPDV